MYLITFQAQIKLGILLKEVNYELHFIHALITGKWKIENKQRKKEGKLRHVVSKGLNEKQNGAVVLSEGKEIQITYQKENKNRVFKMGKKCKFPVQMLINT